MKEKLQKLPQPATKQFKNKPILYISTIAWAKVSATIKQADKEVGWHFLMQRFLPTKEQPEVIYKIIDIIFFPQHVTAGTVTPDEVEYSKWLEKQALLPTFDQIRGHGHSHVNMDPSPSAVDIMYQRDMLSLMRQDGFYFFAIYNKRHVYDFTLYDKALNMIFTEADFEVRIYQDNIDVKEVIGAELKTYVSDDFRFGKCSQLEQDDFFEDPENSYFFKGEECEPDTTPKKKAKRRKR